MRLVIDSNRFMASIIKKSYSRKILLHPNFEFFAPNFMQDEIWKYNDLLLKKSKLNSNEFLLLYKVLIDAVEFVTIPLFQEKIDEANKLIGKIDPKDIPFVAVALALKLDGIWTEDQHFSNQKKIKIYSTQDLLKFIS